MKITIYEKKEGILILNIYYGDMKEAVYNTSAYFKGGDYYVKNIFRKYGESDLSSTDLF